MTIPAIDFKTMRVLSVTRSISGKSESVVRYLTTDNRERTLLINCSDEEHDQCANEFKDYLKLLRG